MNLKKRPALKDVGKDMTRGFVSKQVLKKPRLNKLRFFPLWIVLLLACAEPSVQACQLTHPDSIDIQIHDTHSGSFGREPAEFLLTGCFPKPKTKFIMLAMGPDIINRSYKKGVSYTGFYHNDHCKVKNLESIASQAEVYQRDLKFYEEKTDILRSCVRVRVEALGPKPLQLSGPTDHCQIEKKSRQVSFIRGGYCFIKNVAHGSYKVTYEADPSCTESNRLLNSWDIHSTVALFTAADDTGHNPDLEHLGLIPLRLVRSPKDFPKVLSTSFGPDLPQWPAVMAPDIDFGSISIEEGFESPELKVSYKVNNNCEPLCENEKCFRPCDFTVPVASETHLYEYRSSDEDVLIASGYFGGAVPGRWHGLLPVQPMQIGFDPFEVPNKRFRLELKFAFPDTYYRLAQQNLRQFLIRRISLSKGVGISNLPSLSTLPGLKGALPNLPKVNALPSLRDGYTHDGQMTYLDPLATLSSFLSHLNWPPYYLKTCDPSLTRCEDSFDHAGTTKVSVVFEVDEERHVQLIGVERESTVLKAYKNDSPTQSSVDCSYSPSE